MNENRLQFLIITAEENYAHARDHEYLRAQITSILVAAAFVLIGLAIGNEISNEILIFISLLTISIGLINLWLNKLHTNRFKRHVEIARKAKTRIFFLRIPSKIKKSGNLYYSWQIVACLPIVGGISLLLLKYC
ncbi:hypothetical protein [Pseudoteredinibacter isoporae]|uniref:Uncharacterized protein n=1 Tax=Pseudoteredinibacter isoporae TaxID=570281 RepID=A0A7X0JQP9_9GAMM|nr:hypothetical protein [Pseudoteredinibacter isoporae]MBB6520034.1 hypothetical protein [Pseudoteredinibacter isoporae]NHO85606.1 hypothetical protein [Pseudoteredinibacter isoporae]NIB25942.1 hypothetical protein [Pseudoteredinibacter isoporae]